MKKLAIAFAFFSALVLIAGCGQKEQQKPITLENVDQNALIPGELEPFDNETISSTVSVTEPEDLGNVT